MPSAGSVPSPFADGSSGLREVVRTRSPSASMKVAPEKFSDDVRTCSMGRKKHETSVTSAS